MSLSLAAATQRLLLDPVLALVFPAPCPACGALLSRPSRGPLCAQCWSTLPRHRAPLCACGCPLPGAAPPCGRCRRGLTPFEAGASLGPFAGSLKILIHELKYRGRRRVAARLAQELLREEAVRRVLAPGVVLVPVPLHPLRRRERGFNQSELVALALARRSGHVLAAQALVRRRDTPPQTGLSAAQRRQNMIGAFRVRQRGRIAGRTLVLVDDVMTTGATLRACARTLRAGGAGAVRVLTVARVA